MRTLAYRILDIKTELCPSKLDTTYMSLLKNIYYLPINWRKFIMAFCRTQIPVVQSIHLLREFDALLPTHIHIRIPDMLEVTLTKEDLLIPLNNVLYSPCFLSLMSYICRAEWSIHEDEFHRQLGISFDKEFHATTIPATSQKLSYSGLFEGSFNDPHMHPQLASLQTAMPASLLGAYRAKIRSLKNKMAFMFR